MIFAAVLALLGAMTMIYGPVSGQVDVWTGLWVGGLCLVGAVVAWWEAGDE